MRTDNLSVSLTASFTSPSTKLSGDKGPKIEITTGALCGYNFKQGQRYFVYAKRDKEGKLTEWLCGPTVPLEQAARDLRFAEEIMGGVKGARIVGAVVQHERRDVKDYGTKSPVPGVEVVLERAGQPFLKTVTNGEGEYEFRDLQPDAYHVRVVPPAGAREWSFDGKPKVHSAWLREQTGCESQPVRWFSV